MRSKLSPAVARSALMALIADDRPMLARDALAGLDRLLAAAGPETLLPAGEVAALVRLIRLALPPTNERPASTNDPR